MDYNENLEILSNILNSKTHINTDDFKACLKTLKDTFKQEVSTKFLRGLFIGKTNRQKTKRLNYILKKSYLTTERRIKFFKEWKSEKHNKEITEFQHTNGVIYSVPCELTDAEKQQLSEIDAVKNSVGVELVRHAENDLNERQRVRNAINKGGGVSVKNCYVEHDIGNTYIGNTQEVFYFIKGY